VPAGERRPNAPAIADGHGEPADLTTDRARTFSSTVALPPFQAVLDAHGDEVMRVLRASVGVDEADDCFQETFVAALRAYPRLRPGSNLRAWVLTIAHRKAIDAGRARARRPRPEETLEAGAAPAPRVRDDGLWAQVAALPPKQRAAVAYRYVADLPYAAMAEVMDCSEEAARRSVHEGLRRLAKELER
jgi:RNA polymerase sigma factor (sigma-70 family)